LYTSPERTASCFKEPSKDIAVNVKPLIAESSTSESTNVEVIMNDLRDGLIAIPDYQRDSNQWAEPTKSLLVESIINNLPIPAFFFEVKVKDGVEHNEVIDGQQRLTTLFDFYENELRLVDSNDAPYISPNSVLYAGKKFDQLPLAYQQAFKKYRMTVIKLRQLEDMRLEVFRRINQGGTPLSGQDIRLAYYGENSPSLALIRVVGIYDPESQAGKRFLTKANQQFSISYPWTANTAYEIWNDWWAEKEISRGQTPSESFLWSLIAAQASQLDAILQNTDALKALNVRFNRAIDEALDAYCAQLHWQDTNQSIPPAVMPFDEMHALFFPYFQHWIELLLGRNGTTLPVTKHRIVSSLIGAAYRADVDPDKLDEQQWTDIVEFVRRPTEMAKKFDCEWPLSNGKWDGKKGYRAQMDAAHDIITKLSQ
jgi:hypothetical protein